jgi:sugar O-acyltransferase (sialic acid O-acetyltransferase NeuD family)
MSDECREIVILGTSGFAHETVEIIRAQKQYRPVAFIENVDRAKVGSMIADLEVCWIDRLSEFVGQCSATCCLGTTQRDKFIESAAAMGLTFARVIHPSAILSESCQLKDGVMVCQSVVVASNSAIGSHVRLNRGVLVGHNTQIGDYCTIQPGANIAGFCSIGKRVYVGMGAVILERIEIGDGSVIAAGAVVVRNVPPKTLVMGVPAQIVRKDIDNK